HGGDVAHDRPEHAGAEDADGQRRHRHHRGVAGGRVEQGQFAEEAPRPERRHGAAPAADVGLTGQDEEEGVALPALLHDGGAGGFADPASESARAARLLESRFTTGAPNVVVLVTAHGEGASVDDPAVEAAGLALAHRLAGEPGVRAVTSYWSALHAPPLRLRD